MNIQEIINKYYYESHRFHHTEKHVNFIRQNMEQWLIKKDLYKQPYVDICFYAAVFHDIIYDPKAADNEEKSIEVWHKFAEQYTTNNIISKDIIKKVDDIILSTKHPERCTDPIEKQFNKVDWMFMGDTYFINKDYAQQLSEYENNIFKEYQFVNVQSYVKYRTNFIEISVDKKLITREVADFLRTKVRRKYTTGYYVGSFNPFHIGHMNILQKAEKMFDKVVVAQGINPEKERPSCDLTKVLPYHETETYSNQLVDYINSKRSDCCNPVLVRGLRNGFDLSAESNLISFVNEQADARMIERIPVAYISCDKEFEHVSSSAIKILPEKDRERYIPKC